MDISLSTDMAEVNCIKQKVKEEKCLAEERLAQRPIMNQHYEIKIMK